MGDPVRLEPELSRDLESLSRALEAPDDLTLAMGALVESAVATVPSFVGVTLLLPSSPPDATPVTITYAEGDGGSTGVGSSLLLPLGAAPAAVPTGGPPPTGARGVQIVLYAAAPGAFVDLAADLAWLEGVPLGEVELDAHLSPDLTSEGCAGGVTRASHVDQALGVLIAGGLRPAQAEAELAARASRDHEDLARAAERLLLDL